MNMIYRLTIHGFSELMDGDLSQFFQAIPYLHLKDCLFQDHFDGICYTKFLYLENCSFLHFPSLRFPSLIYLVLEQVGYVNGAGLKNLHHLKGLDITSTVEPIERLDQLAHIEQLILWHAIQFDWSKLPSSIKSLRCLLEDLSSFPFFPPTALCFQYLEELSMATEFVDELHHFFETVIFDKKTFALL